MKTRNAENAARLAALIVMTAAKVMAEQQQQQAVGAPSVDRRIIVSILDRKLALVENGRVVKTFDTAVGAPATPSPEGAFTIESRLANPTWYGPGKVVPPGRGNPIGTRWIGLSKHGYGIHGTNRPKSIGHNASHGCIRMRNENVEELFELVRVGDRVELHGERDEDVIAIFGDTTETATVAAGGGQ